MRLDDKIRFWAKTIPTVASAYLLSLSTHNTLCGNAGNSRSNGKNRSKMATPIERIVLDAERVFGDVEERDTFPRRLRRACRLEPRSSSSEELTAGALRVDRGTEDFPYSVERLLPLAENSATAFGLLASVLAVVRGRDALDNGDVKTATIAFADAYRKNSMVVRWDLSGMTVAKRSFESLACDSSNEAAVRADALLILTHLSFIQGNQPKGFQKLRLAMCLLPEDGSLHATEGCLLAIQMKKTDALAAFVQANRLGCDDIEHTLFHRAILSESDEESRTLLEEFVSRAECDARKLPEACYRLVLCYGTMGPRHLGAARRFLDLGFKADRSRLVIFKDEAFEFRKQAQALARKYHPCGNMKCPVSATMLCASCKTIYYCSRECQLEGWKNHKSVCKKGKKGGKKKA